MVALDYNKHHIERLRTHYYLASTQGKTGDALAYEHAQTLRREIGELLKIEPLIKTSILLETALTQKVLAPELLLLTSTYLDAIDMMIFMGLKKDIQEKLEDINLLIQRAQIPLLIKETIGFGRNAIPLCFNHADLKLKVFDLAAAMVCWRISIETGDKNAGL